MMRKIYFLAVLYLVFAPAALAQELLDVQADNLSIDNKKNAAQFTGNVRVVRAEVTLFADKVDVDYVETTDQGKTKNDVKRIVAVGNVKIIDGKKTITAKKAIYQVQKDEIELLENVVVKEGTENTITGTKMLYDMAAGLITVTADTGRVRATLAPSK